MTVDVGNALAFVCGALVVLAVQTFVAWRRLNRINSELERQIVEVETMIDQQIRMIKEQRAR